MTYNDERMNEAGQVGTHRHRWRIHFYRTVVFSHPGRRDVGVRHVPLPVGTG